MQRSLLISAGGIFLLCVFFLSRGQSPELVYRLILEGLSAGAWLLAAAGMGAGVLRVIRSPMDSRVLAFATSAALGLGMMSLLVLGLGLMGWLGRGTAIGLLVIGLGIGAAVLRGIRLEEEVRFDGLLLLLVPTAALVVTCSFMLPGVLWSDEPAGYDVLAYHLQVPREWYELGRIVPLTHNVFSYFPFNVEMHYLLAMHLRGGVYEGMYLAQLMHAVFVGLSVVAVLGFTAKPQAGVVAALGMGGFPWLMMLGPIAYNEGGVLLFGTLAIVWSFRSAVGWAPPTAADGGRCPPYVVAGVMAGFACGCKLTAVPVLLVGIPVFGFMLRRFSLKGALIFLAVSILVLLPWLIRNQVWAGNPVFPEAASVLGKAHFTDAQVQRWADAHRPASSAAFRVRAIWEQFFGNWRWGFVLPPLSAVAMILSWRRAETRFLAGLLLVQFLFWIGLTHLQGRFLILVAPIVALLIARVESRRFRGVAIAAGIGSAAVGWLILGKILFSFPPSLGVEDFEPVVRASILPGAVAAQVYDTDRPVVLVGEAQAFMYSLPMSRLRYRTVFDVVDWIDPSAPEDAVIVVNPVELRRLARTYSNLPPSPPGAEEATAPFILPR